MTMEEFTKAERAIEGVKRKLDGLHSSLIHSSPDPSKSSQCQAAISVYHEIIQLQLVLRGLLAKQDEVELQDRERRQQSMGRGAFGATYTGD